MVRPRRRDAIARTNNPLKVHSNRRTSRRQRDSRSCASVARPCFRLLSPARLAHALDTRAEVIADAIKNDLLPVYRKGAKCRVLVADAVDWIRNTWEKASIARMERSEIRGGIDASRLSRISLHSIRATPGGARAIYDGLFPLALKIKIRSPRRRYCHSTTFRISPDAPECAI